MPPVGLQPPASPKLLLHTLPAALLHALKLPPGNPSRSRVQKARGPHRDKPIVLLAAIRRENADVVNASENPRCRCVICCRLPQAQRWLSTAGETVTRALCAILGPVLRRKWE